MRSPFFITSTSVFGRAITGHARHAARLNTTKTLLRRVMVSPGTRPPFAAMMYNAGRRLRKSGPAGEAGEWPMKHVKIGVIGAGWWAAENHIPVLQSFPGVEVAAVPARRAGTSQGPGA